MRVEGKKTLAGPKVTMSACPEMRRMSRYFATELRLICIAWAMSVTVIPLGLFLRMVLICESSFW